MSGLGLYKLRERLKRRWFSFWCRGILSTPPLPQSNGDAQFVTVSMVSHRDLMMYLVAVKSFHHWLGGGRVVILNDGSLTPQDLALLDTHLAPARIVRLNEVEHGRCPTGGCWERLLLIADYVADHYVIQVDSDTVTLDSLPEVLAAIGENRSFTLGTGMGRQITTMTEVCTVMKAYKDDHIQVIAEQSFSGLRDYRTLKYVRGCAGFAGFAAGSFSRARVEAFSGEMTGILGERWRQWGSEQVASNFIVANSPCAGVLPHPRYMNFAPDIPYEGSAFLHFIGTHRFKNNVYVRKAADVIRQLKTTARRS